MFDTKSNIHNKHLGRIAIIKSEELNALSPEQYGRKKKEEDIQELNTSLLYYLIRLKRVPEITNFVDIIYNYDLVVHTIASLSLKRANITKELTSCTFTTQQNMEHSTRKYF